MPVGFRYKAFLSYSHKDHKTAAWLHGALEKYRLPKQLQLKSDAVDGEEFVSSDKLGRIFRDRDELPAADDLTAEVRKALLSSEYMIVLCSPRAAASRWVNKEIIEFKKLRGEAAVLPIIVEGEPNVPLGGDRALECFPPGLRFRLGPGGTLSRKAAEPIAADIRKSGDGRQRALLKVIAGLLGVGLDQLVEREMQRKQRRVIAVTAASLIGMLVMGVLTTQAITARREAEVNRAQAEGLVEFMLTDLRQKLDAVGRLDVLDSVGEKAVEYYGAQALEDIPDASLGRRARAFHILGEVQGKRGDMDKAQAMFNSAAATTAGLLARDPTNTDRIFEHSQSVFWVGYQDHGRGNYESTLRAFRKYKELSLQLVEADPDNLDWQLELAFANGNMGTLLLEQLGRPREALKAFLAARGGHERLVAARPDDIGRKKSLANNYAWIADAYVRFGPIAEALKFRRMQQSVLQQILDGDEQDATALYNLMVGLLGESHLLISEAEQSRLEAVLTKAASIGAGLIEKDPSNMTWRGTHGNVLQSQTERALMSGNVARARQKFTNAQTVVAPIFSSGTPTILQRTQHYYNAAYLEAWLDYLQDPGKAEEILVRLETIISELDQEREVILATNTGDKAFMNLNSLKAEILRRLGRETQAKNLLIAALAQLDLKPENINPKRLLAAQKMALGAGNLKLAETLAIYLLERGVKPK